MNPPQVYMCSPSWTLLPPHTIPLGRPSEPALSIQYRASNLDWQLISYMIFYMFQWGWDIDPSTPISYWLTAGRWFPLSPGLLSGRKKRHSTWVGMLAGILETASHSFNFQWAQRGRRDVGQRIKRDHKVSSSESYHYFLQSYTSYHISSTILSICMYT